MYLSYFQEDNRFMSVVAGMVQVLRDEGYDVKMDKMCSPTEMVEEGSRFTTRKTQTKDETIKHKQRNTTVLFCLFVVICLLVFVFCLFACSLFVVCLFYCSFVLYVCFFYNLFYGLYLALL